MCRLAVERGTTRRDRRAFDKAVIGAKAVERVVVEGEIDVIEQPVAHEIGAAQQLLLGRCTEILSVPGRSNFSIA